MKNTNNIHAKTRNAMVKTMLASSLSVLFAMAFSDQAQAARENEPFAYIANQETLSRVLKNIGDTFGMTVEGNVSGGAVSGKYAGASLPAVLNELARSYNFDWFIHGGTIYVYRSNDWVTERIVIGPRNDDFRDSLNKYGLSVNKFKVLEQPERESVVVTGPRSYVKLMKEAFQYTPGPSDSDIMVFKLKYASVEDRVITLRDKSVTTPGIATVLKNILGNTNRQQSVPVQDQRVIAGGNPMALPVSMPTPMGVMATQPDYLSSGGEAAVANNPGGASASGGTGRGGLAAERRNMAMINVQSDARTNSIIIRDRSSRYDQYKKLIDQLDVPLAMVEIEAVMIDIDQRKLDELGTEFGLTAGKVKFDFNGRPFSGALNPSGGGMDASATSGTSAVVTDRAKFSARIQALVANNDARVLAKPTVLTLDNLSAVIDLTQTFYTRVSGERVANVVPVTAGSLLRVSPRIVTGSTADNKEIQLQVDIEDGSLQDRAGIDLPTVQKSAISTQASIRENQAILIGGYNRETTQNFGAKVPVLGDIPFLGRLLQSKSTSTQKVTRLFLITPRVLDTKATGGLAVQ